ncbi:hypothetical protein MTR_8g466470 [Medicago truncatula]|uniref:Uncharacterized protein n=1 Tax=Medicago truncatula TaxID=3880 RepID=A0A072TQ95_MEDTR|nr:hypothetical protein MTR_8g466470 [Medicago truncatula]
MAVSTEHDDIAEAPAQAQYHLPQHHRPLPPPHPLSPPTVDKHSLLLHPIISLKSPPHTQHTHAPVSDQPLGKSNPSVTMSSLHLVSRPYAFESLEHTGFARPAPSERLR